MNEHFTQEFYARIKGIGSCGSEKRILISVRVRTERAFKLKKWINP